MPELPGEPRTVRIVSDGTPGFTHILLPDGTELKGVKGITVHADAGDTFLVVDIRLGPVQLDINAKVDRVTFCCPGCQRDITHLCRNT